MTLPAISIQNLSKKYTLGVNSADSLRERLTQLFQISGRKAQKPETLWALKDINLDIQPGEVLGIIGHNGAGKSTLLKILSRITHPTTGRIELNGRVSSLLEVGTGFHPELTGRENIFMNAAILGMKRAEITKKFDEIVAFAEVEKFIDTPVKRYSSGMYTRLAFSVAAHLDPEILIVDEVLSVGDLSFQQKSLGKMQDTANQGRTVLFVSHNLASIRHLCERVLVFDSGEILIDSVPDEAIQAYVNLRKNAGQVNSIADVSIPEQPDIEMQIDRVVVLNDSRKTISLEETLSKSFHVQIHYTIRKPINSAYVLCHFNNMMGQTVVWTYDGETELFGNRESGNYVAEFSIPERMLTTGRYTVHVAIVDTNRSIIHYPGALLEISIEDTTSLLAHRNIRWPGIVGYNPSWTTHKLLEKVATTEI